MFKFTIALDSKSPVPLFEQLARALGAAIEDGRLTANTSMPSTRDLSARLGLSRGTVVKAVQLLCDRGYLNNRSGQSPTVAELTQSPEEKQPKSIDSEKNSTPPVGSAFLQRVLLQDSSQLAPRLDYGAPPTDTLPAKEWHMVLTRQLTSKNIPVVEYPQDPLGYKPLRESIADYVNQYRAVECDAEQIVLFPNAMVALDFLCRLFASFGDRIVLENPNQLRPRRMFQAHGLTIVPIDLDDQGMSVESLPGLARGAKFLYLTSAHQYPTGVVMPLKRREQLLDWAHANNVLIFEDDYDGEYAGTTKRLPTLQALDGGNSVIYLSSFWRVLFPLVRISFAILPKPLVAPVANFASILESGLSVVEQCALKEFIDAGYLQRQVKRYAIECDERRTTMKQALIQQLKQHVWVSKESSTRHCLIRFRDVDRADEQILQAAAEAGVPLISTGHHYFKDAIPGEFILPFNATEKLDLKVGIEKFARILGLA